ncbi:MAG: type III PLP-dependent enzyme [Dermatophilaceae bacterium]
MIFRRAILVAGATPAELLYSNTVKRADHIAAAHAAGVRLFVVDSHGEVDKVARVAPGSAVVCRLLTSGAGADWPLSRKYGALPDEALDILRHAGARDLDPAGISFHVGSQQRDPRAWDVPVAEAAAVFDGLRAHGFRPHLLDLGGGFPADHGGAAPPLADYGIGIRTAVERAFGSDLPDLVVEPGRGLVGDAGVLVASVIGIVDRGDQRWVFLDAGVFTGLVETLDEAIRDHLTTTVDGPTGPCILAGPTCDSADVLYEKVPVDLPLGLAEGDRLTFHAAGAYTTCYSTVGFNGFAPLPTILA